MSLNTLSLCAAVDGLAQRRFSASELVEAHLLAIARDNPRINCYLHVDAEGALAQARASDARRAQGRAFHPLDGIPIGVKDNIDVAGLPCRAGMATRRDRVASSDAYSVHKLRRAGVVFLGMQNMQEAALGADNDNPHYGACHLPQRHGHTPGGSSGGSAAAVAAHLAMASLGSDTMGSVRIPAAYCGVVGFKPSYGRVSQRGLLTVSRRLDHIGPLVRRAGDLKAIVQQIAGVDAEDPCSRPVALTHAERAPRRLRIGVLAEPRAHGVEPEVDTLFQHAVARIERELGELPRVSFAELDFGKLRRAGLLLSVAEMNVLHGADLAAQPESFSPALRKLLAYAPGRSAVHYAEADRLLDSAVLKARAVFAELDVLLTPTTPQPSFAFGTPVPVNQADLTAWANFAGLPALSLPMGANAEGLPLGLQLVGPVGHDLVLMALAEHIEALLH